MYIESGIYMNITNLEDWTQFVDCTTYV